MYTTLWHAWLPNGLDNMLTLRKHVTAQDEIRWLAEGIQTLLHKEYE